VAAYSQLLEGSLAPPHEHHGDASDSSYTLTYFSEELIQGPDAVVRTEESRKGYRMGG